MDTYLEDQINQVGQKEDEECNWFGNRVELLDYLHDWAYKYSLKIIVTDPQVIVLVVIGQAK